MMMHFPRHKRGYIIGGLLLGLLGCAGATESPSPESPVTTPGATPQLVEDTTPQPTPEPTPDSSAAIASSDNDIWSRLRQADAHYYVLMRHAIAPGTGDPPNFQLDDCSTQRNLSEEGRLQAERTGEQFRAANVAVQQVLSSEWCRCLETAELMELGPVERLPALNSFFENRARGPEQTEQLQEFMVNNRDEAGVTLMVTHFVNIGAIANSNVTSGALVVMQVNDQNELEVVEQIGEL